MPSKRAAYLGDYDETTRSFPILASSPAPVDGEALETWDLTRFEKNPVIAFAHLGVPETLAQLPIGKAEDVTQGPDGLAMRVVLAPPEGNPLADHVAHLVRGKFLRGASVGFEPGPARFEVRDGKVVTVREANVLLEVSLVTLPKDEDAGTSAMRTDAHSGEAVDHLDASSMTKVRWTPFGAARINARIARIGVLEYPGRREFRPPEEVFHPDSLATLKGVPVVDIVDHTGLISPHDFRQKVLGHVEDDVRADGDYVVATLRIEDLETIERIKRGERLDISAGYVAPTVERQGSWRGEPYTHVQSKIVFNHVALCPPGRGRSGPEVSMKLDANPGEVGAGADTSRVIVSNGARVIRAS